MPLFFFTLLAFLSFIQYIDTFLHPWTFAEAHLHSLIADQLNGRHLFGVPSRDSNSGPPYSEPTCYQLSTNQLADTSLGCRVEIRTRTRLTTSRRATNWAMPHPTEPCRTSRNYLLVRHLRMGLGIHKQNAYHGLSHFITLKKVWKQ